jgi:hypothetical protein
VLPGNSERDAGPTDLAARKVLILADARGPAVKDKTHAVLTHDAAWKYLAFEQRGLVVGPVPVMDDSVNA